MRKVVKNLQELRLNKKLSSYFQKKMALNVLLDFSEGGKKFINEIDKKGVIRYETNSDFDRNNKNKG